MTNPQASTEPRPRTQPGYQDGFFVALVIGVALAPIWMGGNRPIIWAVSAFYFGLVTALYELMMRLRNRPHEIAWRMIRFPTLSMSLTSLWIMVQMSEATPDAWHHPIWTMTGELLHRNLRGTMSLDPDRSFWSLLRLGTCSCVFWLTMQTTRSPRRAELLIKAVAVTGAAYAAYGIAAFALAPDTILWVPKTDYLDSLTSTFVNRNSYATYAGIGLIASFSMANQSFAQCRQSSAAGMHRPWLAFSAKLAGAGGWWTGIAFLLAIALVLTGSRGGIVSTLIALTASLLIIHCRQDRKARNILTFSLLVIMAILAALFLSGDLFFSRLAKLGLAADDRLIVYELTVRSILDSPLTGYGYGTFAPAFAMYQDARVGPQTAWDLAHNTYLEIFQGLGIPVALVYFSGLATLVIRCLRASIARRRSATISIVAASTSVLVIIHSFVDFSIQMQGVAITWTALLAAGVAQSWSTQMRISE